VRTGVRIPVGTPLPACRLEELRKALKGQAIQNNSAQFPELPASGVASKIPTMKFLDPDTESAVRDFLARIPADIRLEQAILFGSRARGEHRPDSDADVALILHERGDDGMTLMMLAELAYYAYLDTGIMVQPVPIAIEDWLNPAAFPRPGFLRNVAREGIVL
jgi:predicted nucleotidyltransferase